MYDRKCYVRMNLDHSRYESYLTGQHTVSMKDLQDAL